MFPRWAASQPSAAHDTEPRSDNVHVVVAAHDTEFLHEVAARGTFLRGIRFQRLVSQLDNDVRESLLSIGGDTLSPSADHKPSPFEDDTWSLSLRRRPSCIPVDRIHKVRLPKPY